MASTITIAAATTTVSLKLLVDTKGQSVLCAEAGKDFVDFLFSILLLPVGTVIRLLTKKDMVGCLANLYESVENLSGAYILPTTNKDTLLKPKASSYGIDVPLLLPNIQSSTAHRIYRCSNTYKSNCRLYHANDPSSTCPSRSNVMNGPATFVNPPKKVSTSSAANEGGYVKGDVTYQIMDDLTVTPMSTISTITMLSKLNVKEVGALEEKVINVGMNEGVELLKASLQSKDCPYPKGQEDVFQVIIMLEASSAIDALLVYLQIYKVHAGADPEIMFSHRVLIGHFLLLISIFRCLGAVMNLNGYYIC